VPRFRNEEHYNALSDHNRLHGVVGRGMNLIELSPLGDRENQSVGIDLELRYQPNSKVRAVLRYCEARL
jgi:hypothetical protein